MHGRNIRSQVGHLAIGGRCDHEPDYMAGVPAVGAEFDSQPIQELWMTGPFALRAQIFDDAAQAVAEKLLPIAIDNRTRGQGVLRRDEPPGQIEASLALSLRDLWLRQKGRRMRFDNLAGLILPIAARQHASDLWAPKPV